MGWTISSYAEDTAARGTKSIATALPRHDSGTAGSGDGAWSPTEKSKKTAPGPFDITETGKRFSARPDPAAGRDGRPSVQVQAFDEAGVFCLDDVPPHLERGGDFAHFDLEIPVENGDLLDPLIR